MTPIVPPISIDTLRSMESRLKRLGAETNSLDREIIGHIADLASAVRAIAEKIADDEDELRAMAMR